MYTPAITPAGSYLDFKSQAGDPDSSAKRCATAQMAAACANQVPSNSSMTYQVRRRMPGWHEHD